MRSAWFGLRSEKKGPPSATAGLEGVDRRGVIPPLGAYPWARDHCRRRSRPGR